MIPILKATQFRKHVDRWGVFFQALLDATGMPSSNKEKIGAVPYMGKGTKGWEVGILKRLAYAPKSKM
jgi:hypothetical protein